MSLDRHGPSQSICSQCGQTLHMDQMAEHADWHFAQDLQSQEQQTGSSSVASTPATTTFLTTAGLNGLNSKQSQEYAKPAGLSPGFAPSASVNNGPARTSVKQDRDAKQPTTQVRQQSSASIPPSYAVPAYPPPAANGTTRVAIFTHQNQVTRAAEVRARDEVRRQVRLMRMLSRAV